MTITHLHICQTNVTESMILPIDLHHNDTPYKCAIQLVTQSLKYIYNNIWQATKKTIHI